VERLACGPTVPHGPILLNPQRCYEVACLSLCAKQTSCFQMSGRTRSKYARFTCSLIHVLSRMKYCYAIHCLDGISQNVRLCPFILQVLFHEQSTRWAKDMKLAASSMEHASHDIGQNPLLCELMSITACLRTELRMPATECEKCANLGLTNTKFLSSSALRFALEKRTSRSTSMLPGSPGRPVRPSSS
jgi:hypothetical protein